MSSLSTHKSRQLLLWRRRYVGAASWNFAPAPPWFHTCNLFMSSHSSGDPHRIFSRLLDQGVVGPIPVTEQFWGYHPSLLIVPKPKASGFRYRFMNRNIANISLPLFTWETWRLFGICWHQRWIYVSFSFQHISNYQPCCGTYVFPVCGPALQSLVSILGIHQDDGPSTGPLGFLWNLHCKLLWLPPVWGTVIQRLWVVFDCPCSIISSLWKVIQSEVKQTMT